MVFLNNLIHCDLHPGNILVTPSNKLVFLDAGIAARLGEEDQRNLRDLFRAVVMNEGKEAGRMIVDRARRERCEDREQVSRERRQRAA
jgi:predicted unusual protein kinase regulating ubiquinone biosynthesis (AarF/ABC1/UbiB family)